MYAIVDYVDIEEFNHAQSEMTDRGFNVRQIDYLPDHIAVLWDRREGMVFKDDGTLAEDWPRLKLIIRTYANANDFNTNPMPGFGIRDVHYNADRIDVLWYASLHGPRVKEADAVKFKERWEGSPRFKESPICSHNYDGVSHRKYYFSDTGVEYLCAICGESFAWDE